MHHQRCSETRRWQLPIYVETISGRTALVEIGDRRRRVGGAAGGGQLDAGAVQVLRDAATTRVVGHPREEPNGTTQQGQAARHVERAAADVLTEQATLALDDVDQRFSDHQRVLAHGPPLDRPSLSPSRRGGLELPRRVFRKGCMEPCFVAYS